MDMNKYNYVFVCTDTDFYKASYADIKERNDAICLWDPLTTNNRVLRTLYKIHTSPRINKVFKVPFQGIWNSKICNVSFEIKKAKCYIFFEGHKNENENEILRYIKKKDNHCMIVIFYQDIVARRGLMNIEKIKKEADLVLSFDQGDVQNYDLIYYPLVYSSIEIPENPSIEKSDVFFVGKAKDRLDRIIASYEVLKRAGLKCDFHIIGVDDQDRKYADEIVYQNQMPYIENLQRIRASKCLLEVMQQGGHGYTLRYCEAIMYDKGIITDNPEIRQAPFYDSEIIYQFKNPADISAEFVKKLPDHPDYHFKDKLSPIKLIEFIEEQLEKI